MKHVVTEDTPIIIAVIVQLQDCLAELLAPGAETAARFHTFGAFIGLTFFSLQA